MMDEDDVDGLLERWSPCRASDLWFVVGVITGDRKGRFRDGTLMTTSMLRTPSAELVDGAAVATLNSRDRLGTRATEVSIDAFLYAASLGGNVVGPDGAPIYEIVAETRTETGVELMNLGTRPPPSDGGAVR